LSGLTLAEAKANTGGLSTPSKMPGYSYGIPAQACKVGSRLAKVKGSVCEHCYALKNFYRMSNVKQAQAKRLALLDEPNWVDSMVFLIKHYTRPGDPYFRWHDSGDLQSTKHLDDICKIARRTPTIKHWIPTREYGVVHDYLKKGGTLPANVTVRLSGHMVDEKPIVTVCGLPTSMVSAKTRDPSVYHCPAPTQGNTCGKCRACWTSTVPCVSYAAH